MVGTSWPYGLVLDQGTCGRLLQKAYDGEVWQFAETDPQDLPGQTREQHATKDNAFCFQL